MVKVTVPDPTSPDVQTWTAAGLEVELSDEILTFDGSSPVSVLMILQNSGAVPLAGFSVEVSPFSLNTEKVKVRR